MQQHDYRRFIWKEHTLIIIIKDIVSFYIRLKSLCKQFQEEGSNIVKNAPVFRRIEKSNLF